jgi:uncharacterized protein YpuA (DUF1002 family)
MKEKVEEVINKIKSDPKLLEKFQKNPVTTVEGIIGVDLPDDQINGIVETVKTKLNLDNSGITDKIKGIFG